MTKRILLADDYENLRKGLVRLIKEKFPSVSIDEAADSTGLIELALKNKYDIIITDNKMERHNAGIDAIAELRNRCIFCPMYLMSSAEHNKQSALEAGANGFWLKENGNEEALFAMLKQYVEVSNL